MKKIWSYVLSFLVIGLFVFTLGAEGCFDSLGDNNNDGDGVNAAAPDDQEADDANDGGGDGDEVAEDLEEDEEPCLNNGVLVYDENDEVTSCICAEGFDGEICDVCAEGFSGDTCEIPPPVCDDSSITFAMSNLEAGPVALGYWMFDGGGNSFFDDPATPYGVYAYGILKSHEPDDGANGSGVTTTSFAVSENLAVVAGVAGLTIHTSGNEIKALEHKNVKNTNSPWETMGEAGDKRQYHKGTGQIKFNDGVTDVTVLSVTNIVSDFIVPYPTTVGPGGSAKGYGVADIDVANSNQAWVNEFNPTGNGKIMFIFDSMSPVVQDTYGRYNVDWTIKPFSDVAECNPSLSNSDGDGLTDAFDPFVN